MNIYIFNDLFAKFTYVDIGAEGRTTDVEFFKPVHLVVHWRTTH